MAPMISTEVALQRIQDWHNAHPESFLTFSGGKDSTVVLHLLKQVQDKPRLAFFDTGLVYRQTTEFISNIEKWWGVDVERITTPVAPIDVLIESGNWSRGTEKKRVNMKKLLIDNYLELAQQHFDSRYSMYGLRADESAGRRITLNKGKGIVARHENGEFKDASMSPIWDWATADVNRYIVNNKVPLNTAYRRLRELGVPAAKRRTGVMLSDGLQLGDWALNYQVDPSLGKLLESHLPLLREFR